jgi:hypothetical protein
VRRAPKEVAGKAIASPTRIDVDMREKVRLDNIFIILYNGPDGLYHTESLVFPGAGRGAKGKDDMTKFRFFPCLIAVSLFSAAGAALRAQELPIPNFDNSVVISIEHNPDDAAEAAYIKNRFSFGLYAWPSFSITTLTPTIPWRSALDRADENLAGFKADVNRLVAAAKARGFRLHLVLTSGLARGRAVYKDAKLEDVRNCQWYNDNTIATADQLAKPAGIEQLVFGTLSRYARKVRAHLEAKARAAMAFLAEVMAAEPDTLIAASGWGEAEMNFNRIENTLSVQPNFCDYSPFAVLEFRDWIQHAGEYDDASGLYRKEGWAQGGEKYRSAEGLALFNAEFGAAFTSWNLRYYDWSLENDYDADYTDENNNDPGRIPIASYSAGQMMPGAGGNFTPGGFDPPRTMKPGEKYWDLWNLFRETMVAHFVRDAAKWASESGIPVDRWFSHQIPGDYLFGTNPATPEKNARYYTSASPLWTAEIAPYGRPGATIYDNRFPNWFARTSTHILPAVAALSKNWAVMEYDPEGYPPGASGAESSVADILAQYLRVYEHGVYLINFWRWWDETKEHRIKGMNKEKALIEFVAKIRDKGRMKNLGTVFVPPAVGPIAAKKTGAGRPELILPVKIWATAAWTWKEWGDFDRFEIYRSEAPGVPIEPARLVGKTKDSVFLDSTAAPKKTYYYRVRAVNVKNVAGKPSPEIRVSPL